MAVDTPLAPAPDPGPTPERPARKTPLTMRLGFGDWALIVIGALLATAVSGIGLLSSYKALARKAAAPASRGGWGWEYPWMLPVGVDLSILAFSIVNLILIRTGRPLAWVKWVPRVGTLVTILLNWLSAANLPSQLGHAALAALWVVFAEIAAHIYAAHIDAIQHRQPMEGIRFSRWILAPISTAKIARQMKLWEIRSYAEALELHKARQVYRQRLTQRYGKKWKKLAPTDALLPLRLAPLGVTVTEALGLPGREDEAQALREHEARVRARALDLQVQREEATNALAEVEQKAAIDAAKARAEAARLTAEAELVRAREEARTAAESVVRRAELELSIKAAQADAEAERLRAEAESQAARIRRESEEAQLTWEAEQEQRRVERGRVEQAARDQAALDASRAAAEQARLDKETADAEREAAKALQEASVARRDAVVADGEASVAQAEAERRRAEEEAAQAAADAALAEQQRVMAVALEAASVAAASARRSPAEREAYIVADMIREFGEEAVTLRYIQEALELPHATAQDRRNRARVILAQAGHSGGPAENAA